MPSRGSATPSDCRTGGGGGVSAQMADTHTNNMLLGVAQNPEFRRNQGPAQALLRFGLPVFVRWRCADVVPAVLQSDVSVVTTILDIVTVLL